MRRFCAFDQRSRRALASLDAEADLRQRPTVEKKVRDILDLAEKLKALPQLDEHERLLYAKSLLATPDELWQWNQNHLRSLGLSAISERPKFGYSLPA